MDRTTEDLAAYATSLSYSDLSPEVVHQAKIRVIDSLGCAMGGYDSQPSQIARRLASMYSSVRPARVLGSGQVTSPDMAAFANTIMIRYLDYNDAISLLGGGHPSDMMPAVLAVAEPQHSSAQDVILAVVAAYEIGGAFPGVIPFMKIGWDQGTFIVIGSAVGAGKIMGLSHEQMCHAISLAITPNVPTRQSRAGELSMWKGCATADAVRNGIFAALLAKEGMTGPYEPFEGRHGVWEQVTGPFKLNPFGSHDKPFVVQTSNLKYFPAEGNAQAPLAMAMKIRNKLKLEDIEAINVQTYWNAYSEIGSEPQKWDPQTRETADHSLPYLLAVALQDGTINPASFTPERIRDPNLRPLMNKITVSENPEFTLTHPDPSITEIEVITASGERLVERSDYPRGHHRNPMSEQEVKDKFMGQCEPVLTSRRARTALDTLWKLEGVPDIGRIIDLFQA